MAQKKEEMKDSHTKEDEQRASPRGPKTFTEIFYRGRKPLWPEGKEEREKAAN